MTTETVKFAVVTAKLREALGAIERAQAHNYLPHEDACLISAIKSTRDAESLLVKLRNYSGETVAAAPVDPVRAAAKALIDDVKKRHPGEELRCPYMRALDVALRA